jgi:hypothetical protein
MMMEGDVRILEARTGSSPNPGNNDDADDHYDLREMGGEDRGGFNLLIIMLLSGFDVSCAEPLGSAIRQLVTGTPEDGHLGPKHVVLIAKSNVNEEINSCIID